MRFSLNLTQKGLALVAIPIIFQTILVTWLFVMIRQANQNARMEAHARSVIAEANHLHKCIFTLIEARLAGRIKDGSLYTPDLDSTVLDLSRAEAKLDELVRDSPSKEAIVKKIKQLDGAALQILKQYPEGGGLTTNSLIRLNRSRRQIEATMDALLESIKDLEREEKRAITVTPDDQQKTQQQIRILIIVGFVLNIAVTCVMAVFFSRNIVDRLMVIRENFRRLAGKEKLLDPILGNDEIISLDHAFHSTADMLARLDREKQEFISVISHDLRTPLSSLLGVSVLFSEHAFGQLTAGGVTQLQVASAALSKLNDIITDLLDLDKIATGMASLMPETVELSQLCEEGLKCVAADARLRSIAINDLGTNVSVSGDRYRLQQVVNKILHCAVRQAEVGSTIKLVCETSKDFITLNFISEIPSAYYALLHRYLDQSSVGDVSDGLVDIATALSLSLCRAVVLAHHGSIGVSRPAKGPASIWLTLPVDREASAS